jgi:diguanylate cyclase with GGDEF domain
LASPAGCPDDDAIAAGLWRGRALCRRRLGGEEFLVLLDNTSAQRAANIAEHARAAIAKRPAAGIKITMSFGVCASPPGHPFDYDTCFSGVDGSEGAQRAARALGDVAKDGIAASVAVFVVDRFEKVDISNDGCHGRSGEVGGVFDLWQTRFERAALQQAGQEVDDRQ